MIIDRVSGAFLVLAGLFVAWERRVLPLGSTSHPGPGYVPLLLAGIYCGAMYGGSTTSILMRIPGEAASVMTCIDGYAMARRGVIDHEQGPVRDRYFPGRGQDESCALSTGFSVEP